MSVFYLTTFEVIKYTRRFLFSQITLQYILALLQIRDFYLFSWCCWTVSLFVKIILCFSRFETRKIKYVSLQIYGAIWLIAVKVNIYVIVKNNLTTSKGLFKLFRLWKFVTILRTYRKTNVPINSDSWTKLWYRFKNLHLSILGFDNSIENMPKNISVTDFKWIINQLIIFGKKLYRVLTSSNQTAIIKMIETQCFQIEYSNFHFNFCLIKYKNPSLLILRCSYIYLCFW